MMRCAPGGSRACERPGAGYPQGMPDSADRPNIILITTDQQRGDCLGINGHPVLQTPNLDHLAERGWNFRRGHTECPSCIPARRGLMTGMAPAAQGMVGMRWKDWNPPHTLAGSLRSAGYQSKLVGKLHLQPHRKRFGFEHQELSDGPYVPDGDAYATWLKQTHGQHAHDYGIAHGVDVNSWIGRPGHLREQETHTWWCVERAINFLQTERDPTAPFFLNVSIFDPHPPLVPPEWYYNRYIDRDLPDPVIGDWAEDPGEARGYSPSATRIHLDRDQMRCCRAAYYGTINFVDDQIGRLMQYLRRSGLAGDTFILFTSDHGEMLGDHHLYRKCWPYEASSHVPYLVQPPSSWELNPGRSDAAVGLQDVMPTLLDAAGVEVPESCTGRSLLPILRGERDRVREHLHLEDSGTYTSEDGYHALVDERYKYVWYSQRPCEHLFDLREDPEECHDLALAADAEERLPPWRKRLAAVIDNRPEGFVRDGELVRGRPHAEMVPDYEDGRFFPYL